MPKVSFNPKALSLPDHKVKGEVRRSVLDCAFEPFVSPDIGIEAFMEILRLSNIQRLKR